MRNLDGGADVRETGGEIAHGPQPALRGLAHPIWATAWASLVYSSVVLVGTVLPVYGALLPGSWWWVLLLQLFVCLGIATYLDTSRRGGAWQWVGASITAPATALFYTMGVVLLLTEVFDPITLGIAGGFGLGVLVWAEVAAARMEATGRSVRDVLSS